MQFFKPTICIGHKQREIEDAFATAIDGERYADIDRGWIASYAPPDPNGALTVERARSTQEGSCSSTEPISGWHRP
jgi:hypothetical protein